MGFESQSRDRHLYRVDWLSIPGLSDVYLLIMHGEENIIHGGQDTA